jgi:hypothetical protein
MENIVMIRFRERQRYKKREAENKKETGRSSDDESR